MNMNRFNTLLNKINESLEYVPEKHKEEMIDCIIGEAYDTINYYTNPRQICIKLLKENKDNNKIIGEVCKYLQESNWFCRAPKLLKNSNWLTDFFYEEYEFNNKNDIEHVVCQMSMAFTSAFKNKVDIRKEFWIWTDADDETGVMQDGQFQDYLIEILDEEGEMHGDTINGTYIDIINIIKAN